MNLIVEIITIDKNWESISIKMDIIYRTSESFLVTMSNQIHILSSGTKDPPTLINNVYVLLNIQNNPMEKSKIFHMVLRDTNNTDFFLLQKPRLEKHIKINQQWIGPSGKELKSLKHVVNWIMLMEKKSVGRGESTLCALYVFERD